jgi:hypothetical protein
VLYGADVVSIVMAKYLLVHLVPDVGVIYLFIYLFVVYLTMLCQ